MSFCNTLSGQRAPLFYSSMWFLSKLIESYSLVFRLFIPAKCCSSRFVYFRDIIVDLSWT
ncbi:hypothetical protein CAEBREN_11860 [Caenorhabditis brenneri]|uniref:Uncharacterized protein n=1 Tax=Caenorhabditis brenneri TaxID=135651 RepID=G0N6D4_CAEBE|nr:hypothetical protein CAEBREN_11860 [Caenorhabditis brenneri]